MAEKRKTIVRLTVTGRASGGRESVFFNLFMVDTPEQDDEIVERCGHGVMSAVHFKTLVHALGAEPVQTNIELYDVGVDRQE